MQEEALLEKAKDVERYRARRRAEEAEWAVKQEKIIKRQKASGHLLTACKMAYEEEPALKCADVLRAAIEMAE